MAIRREQLWALLLLLAAGVSLNKQNYRNGLFLRQSGECLEPSQICDGPADCSDKSDENQETCKTIRCPVSTFQCSYGACIPESKKCDGKQDCADNSDELLEECSNIRSPNNGTCLERQFHCNSGKCIDDFSHCDGTKDCKDGSDETLSQCSALSCPDAFFCCGYGACVEENAACDGTIQCEGDGSDEAPELSGTSPLTSQPKKRESLPEAAHCFLRSNNTKDYMIGVGKYHRGWDIIDPTEQRFEIESIEIADNYVGMLRNYADDIAIVVLKTEVTITDFARPVCVDLESKYQREQLSSGSLGTIVHWSYGGSREQSDALLTTNMSFIEFRECFEQLPSSFKPYFSSEKFCAGYANGPSVCPGGGGSGLSFEQEVTPKTKQWFIQGIVSLATPSRDRITCSRLPVLFTDVNKHMSWLKTYYNKY